MFLERFCGSVCGIVFIAECLDECVCDSRASERAERLGDGFTETARSLVPFVVQCPNEWFYCFRIAYTTERTRGFGAYKIFFRTVFKYLDKSVYGVGVADDTERLDGGFSDSSRDFLIGGGDECVYGLGVVEMAERNRGGDTDFPTMVFKEMIHENGDGFRVAGFTERSGGGGARFVARPVVLNGLDERVYGTRVYLSAIVIVGGCSTENLTDGFENRCLYFVSGCLIGVEKFRNGVQVADFSDSMGSGVENFSVFAIVLQCSKKCGNGFGLAESTECAGGISAFFVAPRRLKFPNEFVYGSHRPRGYLQIAIENRTSVTRRTTHRALIRVR